MLKQFEIFLDQFKQKGSCPFDFENYRWESQYGEVFLLTKNLKKELSRHDQWILCLKKNSEKGIVMLRNSSTGEISYLFFPDDGDFLDLYFPVVKKYIEVFDIYHNSEHCLIIPRIWC